MSSMIRFCVGLAICLSISGGFNTTARAAEQFTFDHAVIVADADQPSYVQYGIEDLIGYVKDATGKEPRVIAMPAASDAVQILVGPKVTKLVAPHDIADDKFGDEGYLLRSIARDGKQYLVVSGATPRGTKAGLAALMKAIRVENKSAFVTTPIDRLHKPAVATRGMHFNGWAFNTPYSFRNWSEQEWQQYLNVLAYQGVNLFYLWPFIEIMPVPLSAEDQAYLEECRRVVDYAQKKHGMQVWIMQCTNRVAKDDCGVKDPRRRPYWRPAQEDLNPGNPEHFKAIVASREAMYRIINNVNGVCNIDSDPGYYANSPLSDYVKVFKACREMLDKHNIHGKQAQLIDWMWEGWGLVPGQIKTRGRDEHEIQTIQALKQNLPNPWGLIAGRSSDLRLCRQENMLERTVFLPYGAMEGEPAYPGTNVQIDSIRKLFETVIAKSPELAGVMGNLQTPLLQFPHMYYFSSAMDDAQYRGQPEGEVLLDLAGHLYPEHKQLVADCYLALKEPDADKVQSLSDQLNRLVQEDKLGSLGIFGRKLFPDHRIVAKCLVMQLNLRAAGEQLVLDVTSTSSKVDCQKLLTNYFDAYLTWDNAHGWHALWGWKEWPLMALKADSRFASLTRSLSKALGDKSGVDACFDEVAKALSTKYDRDAVDVGCIAPLKGAVLGAGAIASLAQKATVTASVAPDAEHYPPSAANDGALVTLYWPGALVQDNSEWLQLKWDAPQSFERVIVRFLKHPSMVGRKIRLQRETSPGMWEDFATTTVPPESDAPHSVATFRLPLQATVDKIRIVNLLDLFEVEVY